jgi:glucose-6-phosphate isomerase
VMESIGKVTVTDGESDPKGLTVYGSKGTTDQHAFVQQLREGSDDAVIGFVEVLDDELGAFHPELTTAASDSLSAFLAGTRKALVDVDRYCFTLTLERLDEAHLGALIAFWERVVGFLGALWQLNPYDQPGVEAGKTAARDILMLQQRLYTAIQAGASGTAAVLADALAADETLCFHILRRLAVNGRIRQQGQGKTRFFRALEA